MEMISRRSNGYLGAIGMKLFELPASPNSCVKVF